ncbi:hypothetical protein diail_7132 [Diaporthe ilicicola]|nr:hypothetical protein diail_7132 [Diaporthe ilicicola]
MSLAETTFNSYLDELPDLIRERIRGSRLHASLRTDPTDGRPRTHHPLSNFRTGPESEVWEQEHTHLGRGGNGSVVVLQSKVWPRPRPGVPFDRRAVKIIPVYDKYWKYYLREVDAMIKFSNKGYTYSFVSFLGWYRFEYDDRLYLVTEYCERGDLRSYIRRRIEKRLPEHDVKEIAWQVLRALRLMHGEKCIHGDIKSSNVLIIQHPPDYWWVKVCDLGLSKRVEQTRGGDGATSTHFSPGYCPPEKSPIFESHRNIDGYKADMWCFGELVFHALTGGHCFEKLKDLERWSQTGSGYPDQTLRELKVSEDAIDFLHSVMAGEPSMRPTAETACRHRWIQPDSQPATQQFTPSLLQLGIRPRTWAPDIPLPTPITVPLIPPTPQVPYHISQGAHALLRQFPEAFGLAKPSFTTQHGTSEVELPWHLYSGIVNPLLTSSHLQRSTMNPDSLNPPASRRPRELQHGTYSHPNPYAHYDGSAYVVPFYASPYRSTRQLFDDQSRLPDRSGYGLASAYRTLARNSSSSQPPRPLVPSETSHDKRPKKSSGIIIKNANGDIVDMSGFKVPKTLENEEQPLRNTTVPVKENASSRQDIVAAGQVKPAETEDEKLERIICEMEEEDARREAEQAAITERWAAEGEARTRRALDAHSGQAEGGIAPSKAAASAAISRSPSQRERSHEPGASGSPKHTGQGEVVAREPVSMVVHGETEVVEPSPGDDDIGRGSPPSPQPAVGQTAQSDGQDGQTPEHSSSQGAPHPKSDSHELVLSSEQKKANKKKRRRHMQAARN